MTITHLPPRIQHIGPFGLPRYRVLVIDTPIQPDRSIFGHYEVIWGYNRAWQLAFGGER